MRLRTMILKNFRSYRRETRIPLDQLTVFVGRNDVGKSTILEALEIFFNNAAVQIESADASLPDGDAEDVVIGCVFDDLPQDMLVLDAAAKTSLQDEYLLNEEGQLEIHKVYNCRLKKVKPPEVYAYALHPSAPEVADLLSRKNPELKALIDERGLSNSGVDRKSNVSMRQALRQAAGDLQCRPRRVPLNEADARETWKRIEAELPVFALFRSDRKSVQEDDEVQDPMKVAIRSALSGVEADLKKVVDQIKSRVLDVANRTVEKLREIDPTQAAGLQPDWSADPKWDSAFKAVTLAGVDEIPVNKRGSGFRRLLLLSFFRAEAERRMDEHGEDKGIIYAVEEPETSQHPHQQKLLMEAFTELAYAEGQGCQIVLTTHVPGLAGIAPVSSIRHVVLDDEGNRVIKMGTDSVLQTVAHDLGVFADHRIQVLVCVEGINDFRFLTHLSGRLHGNDASLPDLDSDPRVAVIPMSGDSLKHWVNYHFLRELGRPEIHVYDRDPKPDGSPKYQDAVDKVNARGDGSWATLTSKPSMEHYLHPEAVKDELGVEVEWTDTDDVVGVILAKVNADPAHAAKPFGRKRLKDTLNDAVAARMTVAHLDAVDPDGNVRRWLQEVAGRLTVTGRPVGE